MKRTHQSLRWTTGLAALLAVVLLSGCVVVPAGYYRHGGGHGGYRYGDGQGRVMYGPRAVPAPPVVIVNPPPRGWRERDGR